MSNTKALRRATPVTIGLLLLCAAVSHAAVDPATKCNLDKAKLAAKYAQCRLKEYAKALKDKVPAFEKCDEKLTKKWEKAEAGGSCSTVGDLEAVRALVTGQAVVFAEQVTGLDFKNREAAAGLAPEALAVDGATTCSIKKILAGAKYELCLVKSESTAVKKGTASDTDRCDTSLTKKWTAAETKADGQCPVEGALEPARDTLTGQVGDLIQTLAACGNDVVEAGEQCDGSDPASACAPAQCDAACQCIAPPVCCQATYTFSTTSDDFCTWSAPGACDHGRFPWLPADPGPGEELTYTAGGSEDICAFDGQCRRFSLLSAGVCCQLAEQCLQSSGGLDLANICGDGRILGGSLILTDGECSPDGNCGSPICLPLLCAPFGGNRECGPDGCGGSCGTCPGGELCDALGMCVGVCQPDCTNATCGPDGCGGSCGTCVAPAACFDSPFDGTTRCCRPSDAFCSDSSECCSLNCLLGTCR